MASGEFPQTVAGCRSGCLGRSPDLDQARAADKAETTAAAAASESRLRDTVTYLASDELEGRGVGTAGLDKAAEHLAEEFAKLGLKTDLFDGTPFQKFTLNLAAEMGPAEQNRLTLVGPEGETVLKLGTDFNPLAAGGSGAFDAPLVFAGYGIAADDLKQNGEAFKYDDYAGLDVKGKVVVVIRKEPQQKDAKSPFNGLQNTEHATFVRKIADAADHGAAAVIIVNDGVEVATQRDDDVKLLGDVLGKLAGLKESLAQGAGREASRRGQRNSARWPSKRRRSPRGSLERPINRCRLTRPAARAARKLPVLFATRSAIDAVLKAAGLADLATLEKQIDEDLKPRSAEIPGLKAIGEANVVRKEAEVKNVMAVLEGEGPLADETIVVGAHYDHLGQGGDGLARCPGRPTFTTAPTTTPRARRRSSKSPSRLATSAKKPERRIVFMAFTGEERGLLGSAHYVRKPRFPLEKTIAMFNLDMVGRLTDEKLTVYGTGTAKEFDPLVDALCRQVRLHADQASGRLRAERSLVVLRQEDSRAAPLHRHAHRLPPPERRHGQAQHRGDAADDRHAGRCRPGDRRHRGAAHLYRHQAGRRRFRRRRVRRRIVPTSAACPRIRIPRKTACCSKWWSTGARRRRPASKGATCSCRSAKSESVTLEDFQAVLSGFKPGDKVKTKVRRGTETVEGETTLSRRPRP